MRKFEVSVQSEPIRPVIDCEETVFEIMAKIFQNW